MARYHFIFYQVWQPNVWSSVWCCVFVSEWEYGCLFKNLPWPYGVDSWLWAAGLIVIYEFAVWAQRRSHSSTAELVSCLGFGIWDLIDGMRVNIYDLPEVGVRVWLLTETGGLGGSERGWCGCACRGWDSFKLNLPHSAYNRWLRVKLYPP